MALDTQLADVGRNAALDAVMAELDGGFLRFYDGVKPANANTAITTQTLLAELALSNPAAAGPASSGTVNFDAISDDPSANATGTATWARLVKSSGGAVLDGTVGTSGANINLNSVSIASGASVSMSSLSLSMPLAGS